MYTELNCAFSLSTDTPPQILEILLYMTGQSSTEPAELPPHPLFVAARWNGMLTSSSAYFDGDPHSTVRLDEIGGQYRVTIRCNFKNYDDEITKFIDWITSHIDALSGDFIGYSRYEDAEVPTLPYHPRLFITPQIPEKTFAGATEGSEWWESALPAARK
jgi:hypothetical protein